jgi:ketosteroid isomerase-like protein
MRHISPGTIEVPRSGLGEVLMSGHYNSGEGSEGNELVNTDYDPKNISRRGILANAFLTASALTFGASCGAAESQTSEDGEANKELVREFFRVFSTGKVQDILALMTDDASWWVSGSLEGFSGQKTKAELAEVLTLVGELYVEGALPLSPSTLAADGQLVFAEASGRAELKNGRVYEPRSAFLFTVADGLIAGVKEYIDTLHSADVFLAP